MRLKKTLQNYFCESMITLLSRASVATASVVSWTCGSVFNVAVGVIATGVVVFVVGSASKPRYSTFEPSFNAVLQIEKSKQVFNHSVMDLVVLTAVQSSYDVAVPRSQDSEVDEVETFSKISFGFLNNWFHGECRKSGYTRRTKAKIERAEKTMN